MRPEKSKKLNWALTCASSAVDLIYAFSTVALTHRDPPAKEMAAQSALLTSDGPTPDEASFESQLDRLDQTWEKIVAPLIRSLLSVRGMDQLTRTAWSILAALTAPTHPVECSLERLLSTRYLSGEMFTEKSVNHTDLTIKLEDDLLKPSDIPSFTDAWILKHFEELLDLFVVALQSWRGTSDISGDPFKLPEPLQSMWSNLVSAAHSRSEGDPNIEEESVLRHLVTVFDLEPSVYLPMGDYTTDQTLTVDDRLARIRLLEQLLPSIRLPTLGFKVQGFDEDGAEHAQVSQMKSTGVHSVARHLLNRFLRSSALVLPLESETHSGLTSIFTRLLKLALGRSPDPCAVVLDISLELNAMVDHHEELLLDLWRRLGKFCLSRASELTV